jgi:hypothetical protein
VELCPDQPVDGSFCFFSPCHSRHRHRSEALQFEGSISTQSRPRAAIPTSQPGVLLGLWLQLRSVEQHQTNRTRASLSCAVVCCGVLCCAVLCCAVRPCQVTRIICCRIEFSSHQNVLSLAGLRAAARPAQCTFVQTKRSGLDSDPSFKEPAWSAGEPPPAHPAPCSLLSSTPELLTRSNVLIKTVQSKSP